MSASFGRQCLELIAPSDILVLEHQMQRSERFQALDALVGTLLVRCLRGEQLVTISGDTRTGWQISLQGLSAVERQFLEATYRLEQQQAQGAWFLPAEATLEIGLANLPWLFRQSPRFAGGVAREEQRKVALGKSADAVFHWAVLNPLCTTLFLPIELRGRQAGKYTREEVVPLWAEIDQLLEALGFSVAGELAIMRYGGGWSHLHAQDQMVAKQRYLAALAQQAQTQMGSRFRVSSLQKLTAAYYQKAKDGLATRKQVLSKALEPLLAAFFGGDWLAFLEYLGEPPHPDEEVVTALPETHLYLGGQQRAAEVAAQLGVPASEVAKIAAALWKQAGGQSPIEQRLAVLDQYWQLFELIHTRQAPGMRPLWGLVEESPPPFFLRDQEVTPYQPQLYRELLPPALLQEIPQFWGTMMLPGWPDRLVSTPFPHALLAEAMGPALSFWHGCALTAWFVCEGPSSRTDMAGLAQYYRVQLQALRHLDMPIDPRLFEELIRAEQQLIPEPPRMIPIAPQQVRGQVAIALSMSIGPRRKQGFERLRDIITTYRRAWTEHFWQAYARRQAEQEIREASQAFNQHLADKGRAPTLKQFAKAAAPATNHWFGGDVSGLYGAIGEKAPPHPTRSAHLPADVMGFAYRVHRTLLARVGLPAVPQGGSTRPDPARQQLEQHLRTLAELSIWFLQLWEALDREPTLKEFGPGKFERSGTMLARTLDEAWQVYVAVIKQVAIGTMP